MRTFLFVSVLFFSFRFSCFSQDTTNLVPNWSFEEHVACPSTGVFEDFVIGWFNPTACTPNYFDSCATIPEADVPYNLSTSFQHAKNGNSYAGIVLYGGSEEREYISVRLNSILKLNHKYCFELFYSLANICCNSTPDLHACFSPDSIYQNNINSINRTPQVLNTNENFADTINWQLMSGEFTSDGTELYLNIGNFFNDSSTNLVLFDTNFNSCSYGGAYYYIDAVRLFDCTEPDTTVYETSLFPNPNNGIFTVNYNLGDIRTVGKFSIYDAIGKLVYDEKLTQNNGRLNLNLPLAEGVYFWSLYDETKAILQSDKMVIAR